MRDGIKVNQIESQTLKPKTLQPGLATASDRMEQLLYEYNSTHAQFCGLALANGIQLPSYDNESKRYFILTPRGSATWDSDRNDTWDKNFGKFVSQELRNVLDDVQGRISALQTTDEGLDEYFSCMANPSLILTLANGTKIWQCSSDGVSKFGIDTLNPVRVCLGASPKIQGNFHHIDLNDGYPMMINPSLTPDQFKSFISTLEKVLIATTHPNQNIIINCSQGQSRSGLFVICLLMHLARRRQITQKMTETIPLNYSIQTTDSNRLLCSVYSFVNFKRVTVHVNPKFIPFMVFMAENIHSSYLN